MKKYKQKQMPFKRLFMYQFKAHDICWVDELMRIRDIIKEDMYEYE